MESGLGPKGVDGHSAEVMGDIIAFEGHEKHALKRGGETSITALGNSVIAAANQWASK